jgi:hypothetical protein
MPVVVDPPGLYESVTARIGFGPDDLLYRSTLTNVGPVNYSLRPDLPPEVADFSRGRDELLTFMADCETSGTQSEGGGAGATDAVLQP